MAKPIPTPIPDDVKARFWAKIDARGPDDCWEWTADRSPKGYGRFKIQSLDYREPSWLARLFGARRS